MAEQVKYELKSFSWSISFDEPTTIQGTIRFIDKGVGCWAIVADVDPPMPVQLEGLDPELRRDGLRVELTAHVEQGKVGDCLPPFLFFVDEAKVLSP